MNARLTRSLSALMTALLAVGTALPALAQAYPPYTSTPLPPIPAGNGWRPVNPQPLSPGQTQFNLQSALLLRSGDIIAATYRSNESLYLGPGETRPVSLTLDSALRDPRGNLIVPAGAVVEGQFQPVSGGSQFIAQSVTINNQSYPLFAQSGVIAGQRDPRESSGEAILGDALIGVAAGALLGGLTGDGVIATEEILGAAAAGAVIGNVTAPEVIVIKTDTPLNLTVTQDFQPVIR